MITVNGKEIEVRQMTAGDLAVLAPLAERLRPLVQENSQSIDMNGLLAAWPEILPVAEQLLGGANLRAQPMHEVIRVLHELIIEWVRVNGKYLAEEVAPAVSALAADVMVIAESVAAKG